MRKTLVALLCLTVATVGAMTDAASAPPAIRDVPVTDVPALAEKGAVVIDVRRADEWRATGTIPGSLTITAYDKNGALDPNFVAAVQSRVEPDRTVVLVCRSGNRSGLAAKVLAEQAGYRTLYNALGGMLAWGSAGRPTAPCAGC